MAGARWDAMLDITTALVLSSFGSVSGGSALSYVPITVTDE